VMEAVVCRLVAIVVWLRLLQAANRPDCDRQLGTRPPARIACKNFACTAAIIVGSVGILLCARHKIGLLLTCADDVREYCFMHLLSTPFFDTH
jgi:hypothetical protein